MGGRGPGRPLLNKAVEGGERGGRTPVCVLHSTVPSQGSNALGSQNEHTISYCILPHLIHTTVSQALSVSCWANQGSETQYDLSKDVGSLNDILISLIY